MIRLISIIFILFYHCFIYAQNDVLGIINKSERFYTTINSINFKVNFTFKSAIAESFNSVISEISFCKINQRIISVSNNIQVVLTENKYYYINRDKKEYIDFSNFKDFKKEKRQYFDNFPHINSNFFDRIKKNQSQFKKENIGAFFHIYNQNEHFYFDTIQYMLMRYKNLVFDINGIQIKEWVIENQKIEKKCSEESPPIKLLKKLKKVKSFETTPKNPGIIGKEIKSILPDDLASDFKKKQIFFDSLFTNKKFILLDFFYQSCMPCIIAFKFIKELKLDEDSANLEIIGIDPNFEDSSSMEKFKRRYRLKYNVILGRYASMINKSINPAGYFPYYILINPKGIIIETKEGFDEFFFKRVKQLVSK